MSPAVVPSLVKAQAIGGTRSSGSASVSLHPQALHLAPRARTAAGASSPSGNDGVATEPFRDRLAAEGAGSRSRERCAAMSADAGSRAHLWAGQSQQPFPPSRKP
eukprot:6154414-Lingulodinium_polyedra.AAC.1